SFAGYERYLGNRLAEHVQSLPGGAWSVGVLSRMLPDSLDPKNRLRQAKRFLAVAAQPMPQRYGGWLTHFTAEAKQGLYSQDWRAQLNGGQPSDWMDLLFADVTDLDPVDAAMAVDVRSYLP